MRTSTAAITDTDVVRTFFRAVASADRAALGDLFHDDATWRHRNDDRLGGIHKSSAAIMAYLAESAQLTAGSLRAVPQFIMADDEGHVSALVRLSATRPDGRSMDGPQLVLFTIEGGRVRSIDQFVGDPTAVAAPWYGPRNGRDEVVSFFEAIGKTGPVTEFTPLAYTSNDEGDVMVFLRYAFTVTATGKNVAMNMHHYFKFRDGKVCYVRRSEDTAQVAAAPTP